MAKQKITQIKKIYSKKDKYHNFNHILRIKKKVKILRKSYKKINEDLLSFLILYHGLKNYVKKNKKDFQKDYVISLFRHSKSPLKIEEKLVYDANMLDNLGKQGIKKALYVGKKFGRNKEQTFAYLRKELNGVKLYTKKGKVLGKKEIEIMKKILK